MTKAYLEPEEIKRIEEAATNLRDKLLIYILFRLGCRITEGVYDIDFTQGTVTIIHLKRRVKESCPDCHAAIGAPRLEVNKV